MEKLGLSRWIIIGGGVVILILLAALVIPRGSSGTPTAIPNTAAPTKRATKSAPTNVPATAIESEIVGKLWQWQGTRYNDGRAIYVDNLSNYTLQFLADGTVNVRADCNTGSGTFQIKNNSLTIRINAMTLAACPPGSLADEFVNELGQVAQYHLTDPLNLVLNFQADSGSMKFATGGAALVTPAPPALPTNALPVTPTPNAPQAPTEKATQAATAEATIAPTQTPPEAPTQGPTAQSTPQSTAQPTITATQELQSTETPPATGESNAADLVERNWLWINTTSNNGTTAPSNSGSYSIQFAKNGTVAVQADCNNGTGSYTVQGSSLSIQITTMTQAQCPEGSAGQTFVEELSRASKYQVATSELKIQLKSNAGTMHFASR